MKYLFLISLVLGVFTKGIAQHFTVDKNFDQAYTHLLNLNFDDASVDIKTIKDNDPQNLAHLYLEDLSDFLFIVVTEDQKEFEIRKEQRSQRLKAVNQLSDNSPYKLLMEGEIHLHWAFSKMRFGEYLSGARDINKSFHALEKNMKKFPDFLPTYKSMGLLHTLIGTVPDNYRWATNLMGVDGTIEQGISEMELVIEKSENDSVVRNLRKETLFLLSFLHINLLNDSQALVDYSTHVDKETGPLMVFAKASLLNETGETDMAIETLETSIESLISFPYLNFLLGELKLARMDADADVHFLNFIKSFKGNSYLKASYQKLAWHGLLVKESPDLYNEYIGKVGRVGNTMLDEDKSAQKELDSKKTPNQVLLTARLLFDGGYYADAWKTLINEPKGTTKTTDEQLEWYYRLARIKQEMGDIEHAISLYSIVVETGRETKRYFGANASLQLGLIHEELGKKEKALVNFKECSKFSNTEYRNSINQKAKAGVLRLSD